MQTSSKHAWIVAAYTAFYLLLTWFLVMAQFDWACLLTCSTLECLSCWRRHLC